MVPGPGWSRRVVWRQRVGRAQRQWSSEWLTHQVHAAGAVAPTHRRSHAVLSVPRCLPDLHAFTQPQQQPLIPVVQQPKRHLDPSTRCRSAHCCDRQTDRQTDRPGYIKPHLCSACLRCAPTATSCHSNGRTSPHRNAKLTLQRADKSASNKVSK